MNPKTKILLTVLRKYWWTTAKPTEPVSEYVDKDGFYMGIPNPDLFRSQVFIRANKDGVVIKEVWPQEWIDLTSEAMANTI